LPREEWAQPGVPALAGWQAQGKKVSPPPLRQGDRGFAVLWPDHAIKRPRGSRARQTRKEKTGQTWSLQEAMLNRRRSRNISYEIFLPLPARNGHLVGEGIQILRHPHLYPLRPWRAQDEIIHSQRDLSSRDWIIAQSPKDGPVRPARSSPREPSSETSPAR
jgi:hypothetical protein